MIEPYDHGEIRMLSSLKYHWPSVATVQDQLPLCRILVLVLPVVHWKPVSLNPLPHKGISTYLMYLSDILSKLHICPQPVIQCSDAKHLILKIHMDVKTRNEEKMDAKFSGQRVVLCWNSPWSPRRWNTTKPGILMFWKVYRTWELLTSTSSTSRFRVKFHSK